MIAKRRLNLKPLLDSEDGLHLSVYLVPSKNKSKIRAQLRESLNEASEWLNGILSKKDELRFLGPLRSLVRDPEILMRMPGHIGLFRNQHSFRILNIPVPVERQCFVANSFHVKPLLRWLQIDRDFILLGQEGPNVHFYSGSLETIRKIGIFELSEVRKAVDEFLKLENKPTWATKIFFAGPLLDLTAIMNKLGGFDLESDPLTQVFDPKRVSALHSQIGVRLKALAEKAINQTLMEVRFADEMNLVKRNIFQIAKAALKGKVSKLIIADGINVFGKINKSTGGVSIHPFDLDHEDDDLLDDLAQEVLARGGEVIVMPRESIPKGRPILAILGSESAPRNLVYHSPKHEEAV